MPIPQDDALPFDKLREECGVVAIHNHPDAARQAYLALYSLQHRGQESAGIATADHENLWNIKGMGLVAEIFTDDVLAKLPGSLAIGHTRYSTTGDSALLNAQPIRVDSTKGLIAIAHNGNLVHLGNLRTQLEREGAIFQTTSDSEIIVQLIAHSKEPTLIDAIADSLRQVEGAFSIVMMTRDRIFAARDPRGFRPLSMGRIANADGTETIVFASETCAFDLLRATYEREVKPGELVMVSREGVTCRQFSSGVPQASCVFEHVYFSRPDSRVFGRWVQESREEMGRQLARESGVEADLVVPVPDSGVTAAIGYAAESGIPFRFGLIRNHYVGRTFIEPEQRVRDFGVKLKLNPVRNLLEGKRVILIDDSIIRGTTSRKIVRMVRGAGATEVHLRISCPPTTSPCFYGAFRLRISRRRDYADRRHSLPRGVASMRARMETLQRFASGAESSGCVVRFDLVPRRFLERVAARFGLGAGKYGERKYRNGLRDRAFIVDRLNHLQHHVQALLAPQSEEEFLDDNLGAIGWAAAFLCEVEADPEGAKILEGIRMERAG